MFRTGLMGAAIVVAAIGYPCTANAQPFICGPGTYQNVYGVCLPTANAAYTGADAEFFRLLTRPNQDHPMVIWDFPGVKGQGLWACQRMNVEAPYLATKELQSSAGYAWDDATSITSAAVVAYCPQNGYAPTGKWPSPSGT